MILIAATIFWICVFLLAYTYFLYPVLVRLLAGCCGRPVRKANVEPSVSLIIAAYNEEKTIRAKLENSLNLKYPQGKLEILVAAYGSTDKTVEIASEFADRGVRVLHRPGREGKTMALNRAVQGSSHDILFFSDANTFYHPETIRRIVRNFADPEVGGVSGRKVVLQDAQREATNGETAYWRYESSLKHAESLLGSIVTADGEIFAMRRALYEPMPATVVHDDMYLSLRLVQQGFRLVYEEEATSAEQASRTVHDEFHLKTRYASAGFQIVAHFRSMLLPPLTLFGVQFFSHKILRWLAPLFLVGVFTCSALIPHMFYRSILCLQVAFYALAAIGYLTPKGAHLFRFMYFPMYFSVMNMAAAYGLARYLTAGQSPLWRKVER